MTDHIKNSPSGVRMVSTAEYLSVLRELTEAGEEVQMTISGSSMFPFLAHARDIVTFKKPMRDLQVGDIVFYQRPGGQYVMHRICRIGVDGYYLVGDAQTDIEGPVAPGQIFALITGACRCGKWLGPKDFIWRFFSVFWIRVIRFRPFLMKLYRLTMRILRIPVRLYRKLWKTRRSNG